MNIAFDLDGTLISCAQRHSAVLQSICNALSLDCDTQKIWEYKRNGSSTEAALVKMGMTATLARQIAGKWKRIIEEPYWLSMDSLLVGGKESLKKLKEQCHHLYLLTARDREDLLMLQLAQLGIRDLFEQIHVVRPERAREQKAARLKAMAAQIFIGDTESDFQAAGMAEVVFYAVSTGQRSQPYLQTQGITNIFSTLQDALNRVSDRNRYAE